MGDDSRVVSRVCMNGQSDDHYFGDVRLQPNITYSYIHHHHHHHHHHPRVFLLRFLGIHTPRNHQGYVDCSVGLHFSLERLWPFSPTEVKEGVFSPRNHVGCREGSLSTLSIKLCMIHPRTRTLEPHGICRKHTKQNQTDKKTHEHHQQMVRVHQFPWAGR